jgi:phosphoribosylformylglycinamidine synthase
VQKGNAPVERKLQRLFRNPRGRALIKRCNDFGAGGVSVAIGELAPTASTIDLDKVPKKYEGLDGTELAISEVQERMACRHRDPKDVDEFWLCREENLEATVVATSPKSRGAHEWNGDTIVDLSRAFLDTNGAPEARDASHIDEGRRLAVPAWERQAGRGAHGATSPRPQRRPNKGLSERFDSTIGAGTVLMPFGGKYQLTPPMAMVAKLPVLSARPTTVLRHGLGLQPLPFAPTSSTAPTSPWWRASPSSSPPASARKDALLTFQEYFEQPARRAERWGKPAAALLGALMAQLDLGVASIGGKDSMSGSFEDLDVPPTLVSFATACGKIDRVTISPSSKGAGHNAVLHRRFRRTEETGLPTGRRSRRSTAPSSR